MRKGTFTAFVLAFVSVVGGAEGAAWAQGKAVGAGGGRGENKPGKLVVDKDMSSSIAAQQARARAAKGDCAGALDAFDEALRTSIDPSLHRDRGLCHDKLGHPFPAMDDYRWYLTAEPNAPDADRIRQRLEELEAQNGVGGAGTSHADDRPSDKDSAKAAATINVSTSGMSAHTEAPASEQSSKDVNNDDTGETGVTTGSTVGADNVDSAQRLADQAERSPLRRGKGFGIGAVVGMQAWSEDSTVLGSSIAFELRYSVGTAGSLMGEIGVQSVGQSDSENATKTGPQLALGWEFRFGLDERFSNAILLSPIFDYDRLKQGATGLVFSTIHPKLRAGYRHVFGYALGLEGNIEAGYAVEQALDVPDGATIKSTTQGVPVIGGTVALVLGF